MIITTLYIWSIKLIWMHWRKLELDAGGFSEEREGLEIIVIINIRSRQQLPSESIISNILSIIYTFLPSAQGSLSSAKIEFLKVDFGILSFLIIMCKKAHKEA